MDIKGMIFTWLFFFGLVTLIFFIGRAFGRLAISYNKNKLAFTIAGILVFSLGVFVGSEIEMVVKSHTPIDSQLFKLSGYIRLPIGLLICWTFYKFLADKWRRVSG